MHRNFRTTGAAIVGALLLAGPAAATELFDNLSATSGGEDLITSFGPLADSFSTTSAFKLSDVQLLLDGASSGGSITVNLLNDAGSTPGSVVIATTGPLLDSFLSGSPAVIDFSLTASLSANTRYWIQLSSSDTSGLWEWSTDISGLGVANEFFANQNGVFGNADGPYQMAVSGLVATTGVPEPSTWMMLMVGAFGAGAALRSRRGVATTVGAL